MEPEKKSEWQRAREFVASGNHEAASIIHRGLIARKGTRALGWLGLSDVALSQERFRDAVAAVRNAADCLIPEQRWDLIAHITARLLSLGEYRPAANLLFSMPRNHPAVLRHAAGLAQYLGLCEQHATALAFVSQALSSRPSDDPDLLYEHAMVLRHLGRLDEATEAYERCLSVDPGHARAHWSLAYHAPAGSAGCRIDRLNQAVAKLAPGSADAVYLHYALYREHENAGNLDAAWASLAAGTAMKRARLRYDSKEEEHRYRRLMDARHPKALSSEQAETGGGHCPIFVVGLPRSGTTLLERILANHSRVKSAGEIGDLHIQLCHETDRIARDVPDNRLLDRWDTLDFGGIGRRYLERTRWRAAGHDFLIDKFPVNIAYAGLIHAAMPQAKIICLQRNPVDSCFSGFKELFPGGAYPHSYDLDEMVDHYLRFRRLLAHWDTTMPGVILTISYERLVSETDATMREVFSYCGLPADEGCTDIVRNGSPSSTASSSQIREPIHARNVGGWHRYRSQLDNVHERLERILGNCIE